MRSLWLASAAFIVTTTIACAQTTTPAPAPNGASNAPVETAPGLSPGKAAAPASAMAPGTTTGGSMSGGTMSQGSMSQGSMSQGSIQSPSPAPNGSTNAPQMTQAPASPGKSAPSNSASTMSSPSSTPSTSQMAADNGSAGMAKPMHHFMGAMPANGSAGTYLHIAKFAIRHNDKARAEDALSHAETRLLTRSVPQSSTIPTDDSPAVTAIEQARQAVKAGNWQEAAADTDAAIHQMHHGMMDNASDSSATPE